MTDGTFLPDLTDRSVWGEAAAELDAAITPEGILCWAQRYGRATLDAVADLRAELDRARNSDDD